MSSKYGESAIEIMKQLAFAEELTQQKIPDLANCSYRTVMRELPFLEKMGWIEFVRERREKRKKGPPENIWRISFKGLMAVIGFIDVFSDDYNKIVESHKNEWIIFNEWNYISKNDNVKMWVLNELKSYCDLHKMSLLLYYNWYKRRMQNDDNIENIFNNDIEYSIKQDLAEVILGVDNILSFYGTSLRSNIYPRSHECFKYFLQNSKLKTFIIRQINSKVRKLNGVQRIKQIYNLVI